MELAAALQLARNFATHNEILLGELRVQVLHELEGSWSLEFDDPVDPARMLWSVWVHPTGEVRAHHLPTAARLSSERTTSASKLRGRFRNYWRALVLVVVLASCAGGCRWVYLKQVAYMNFHIDDEFVADHQWACYELGVAIRYPKAGLFGKARYWVVVIRDHHGNTLKTIYEGPGGYPDVPVRPTFLAIEGETVTYETDDLGKHTIREPLLKRKDCGGET